MVTKSVGLTIAAVSVTVVLAGCSSSGSSPTTPATHSPSGYTQVLQRIASQEGAAQQHLAEAFQGTSVSDLRAAMQTFQSEQAGLATQLAALMPPANAVAANTALAHAFADSAGAMHSLIGRIAHAKTVTKAFYVIQSDRATQQVAKAIADATAQLRELGYLTAPPVH